MVENVLSLSSKAGDRGWLEYEHAALFLPSDCPSVRLNLQTQIRFSVPRGKPDRDIVDQFDSVLCEDVGWPAR
jgi:hypothetical protein